MLRKMSNFQFMKIFFKDLICIAVLLCGLGSTAAAAGPIVHTATGDVEGKYIRKNRVQVAAYLGIPFAEPPLGNRRFSVAEPVTPWKGVRPAKELPPACLQLSLKTEFAGTPALYLPRSEDCLYLNVWVPMNVTSSEKLPVMFWIYGGGLITGSNNIDLYDGSVISSHGKVIVVTVNYRVGLFGFLYGGSEDAPGGVGLRDPLVALRWVNANIKYFGGDPDQVTLFGESAGGLFSSFYLLLPEAQDLFNRVIIESVSPNDVVIFGEDKAVSQAKTTLFATAMGCAIHPIACLRSKKAEDLAEAESKLNDRLTYFFPTIGGYDDLMTHVLRNLLSKNAVNKTILIGSNLNEYTSLFSFVLPEVFPSKDEPLSSLDTATKGVQKILDRIPMLPPISTRGATDGLILEAVDIYSDVTLNCMIYNFVSDVNEAYLYLFSYRSKKEKMPEWMKVYHTSEIQYVFGKPFSNSTDYTNDDRRFSSDMIKKWTNFARYGHPFGNGSKRGNWPKFNPDQPEVYELNLESPGMKPHPKKQLCQALGPVYKALIMQKLAAATLEKKADINLDKIGLK